MAVPSSAVWAMLSSAAGVWAVSGSVSAVSALSLLCASVSVRADGSASSLVCGLAVQDTKLRQSASTRATAKICFIFMGFPSGLFGISRAVSPPDGAIIAENSE